MPCRDFFQDQYDLSDARKECEKLTRLLCQACDRLAKSKMTKELKAWWEEHQEADRERQAEEEAEKEAHKVYLQELIAEAETELRELEEEDRQ
jgi:hypothetical protein